MEQPSFTESYPMAASLTSDESLHYRFHLLKKTKQQTKELNFSLFNQDKERVDVWLHKLEPHLKRCNTIKMKFPFRFSDKLMISTSHALYKLDQLRNFTMNASGSRQITDQGLKSLSQTLSRLHKLNKLKLDFSRCNNLTDQALIHLGQCIYRLKNLTSLTISFSGCEKITDDSVIKLGQRIAKISQLEQIKLIFSNCCKITDEGVSSLARSLSTLPSLTHMTAKFYRCSLTDQSLQTFGESLPELKKVRKLSLTISSGEKTEFKGITSSGTSSLSEGITRLDNLKSLTLKFGWSDTLNNESLACLNQNLLKLQKLTCLQLGFYYCKDIDDTGIKYLTNNIAILSNIKTFKINLWSCQQITNEALLNISWNIVNLPNLVFAQLASERYGWMSFSNKSSILRFAAGLSMKKFRTNIVNNKPVLSLTIGLFMLVFLWALISRFTL